MFMIYNHKICDLIIIKKDGQTYQMHMSLKEVQFNFFIAFNSKE